MMFGLLFWCVNEVHNNGFSIAEMSKDEDRCVVMEWLLSRRCGCEMTTIPM